MADARWQIKVPVGGTEKVYTFDPGKQLTVGTLRQIKAWYPELGRYMSFIAAFAQGDPEAALCAVWMVRKDAGETDVPEPNQMDDFPMGGFYHHFDPASDEEERPTEAVPTPDSTPTPTGSEENTSGDSEPTPDTPPET